MSKFDYDKARSTAEKLIDKFGGAGTVYSLGESGEDMFGNPISSPGASINGLVTPLLQYKQMEIGGNTILSTDSYVFFHSDIEPEINMLHDSGGDTYRVVDVKKIDSVSGTNVYRKLQLRK